MVDNDSSVDSYGVGSKHSLNMWTRICLHGLIAFAVICAVAYVVTLLAPIFDFTGNRALAIILSIVAILVGPPLLGSIILFGVFPLLGKNEAWRGLLAWDDRILAEVSGAKEKARVVIINWPSKEVRTMGVLTATFASEESGRQLAAVYVPTAPQTKLGYIRIVELDDVEFTDWTLKQWQLYQFTFGSVSPDEIH
jgi:uncharacterized membrane protein